jgi:hypothetical protein
VTALFSWLASFLTGPLLQSGVDAWKAKLQADSDKDKIAADLAGRELIVQQRELELQTQLRIAELGRWWEPDKLMGYAVALYFGKLLIWDKVLGLGSTDPLAGFAAVTANLVVSFYFAKRGFENIARIIKR